MQKILKSRKTQSSGKMGLSLSAERQAQLETIAREQILAIAETRCPVADNLGTVTPVLLRRAVAEPVAAV